MLSAALAGQLNAVENLLPSLDRAYYRLTLVVGKAGTGKTALLRELSTRTGHPLINVNLQISERLLDHTIAERPRLVPRFLGGIVKEANSHVVLLDNPESACSSRTKRVRCSGCARNSKWSGRPIKICSPSSCKNSIRRGTKRCPNCANCWTRTS